MAWATVLSWGKFFIALLPRAVSIAAGMWLPDTAQRDARAALLPVASSLKALLASVEAVRSLQMSDDVCRVSSV